MERLLRQVVDADDTQKHALFGQAADLLTIHIKAEEDIFYPAVNHARTEDDLLESLEEHLSLKRLLADLLELDPSEKSFEAKFHVLTEQAEHHHKEEEEHLFPAVLKMVDPQVRLRLGREMRDHEATLKREGEPREAMSDETDAAAPLPQERGNAVRPNLR